MRYLQLDLIRGIAIILMVIFHVSFDLNNFHFISIDIYNHHSHFWYYFRLIIVTLFLVSVGISLSLSYQNGINYEKLLKRMSTLTLASLVISIVTYFIFPHSWIYFGVLHFITLATLLGLPFLKHEYIALILGISIVLLYKFDIISMHPIFNFIAPYLNLPHRTEDLVPLTPWFGVVLIGIFIGEKRLFLFPLIENNFTKKIAFLGKHSLFIYLVHQPIFFGAIWAISAMTH